VAISQTVDVITNALWPQGDIRDPLGIWGFRHGVTGDASAGGIKVLARSSAGEGAAYVYTVYSTLIAIILQATFAAQTGKCRILTSWPNIDPQAGVQAYGSLRIATISGETDFTAPQLGPDRNFIQSNDRFLLIFDPRPSAGVLDMIELEIGTNVLADTYSFEGYGYYWDRSVLNAPGGPRHPGAS